MTIFTRSLAMLCGAAMLVCVLACGGVQQAAARARAQNDLKQLILTYHMYVDTNSKAPASAADLSAFSTKMAPEAVPIINSGAWTVFWGATPAKMTAGASKTILAHGAPMPDGNTIVAFGDGVVQVMSASELAAAPKAVKDP